jgi:hypothetical protein
MLANIHYLRALLAFWLTVVGINTLLLCAQSPLKIIYATSNDEFVEDGCIDELGNAIMVGGSRFPYTDQYQGLLLKLYPTGQYKTRLVNKADTTGVLLTCTVLGTGNYFVTSIWKMPSSTYYSLLINMVFDTTLNLVSEKRFSIPNGYEALGYQTAIRANDGNIVIAALIGKWNGFRIKYDNYLLKFTPEGDSLVSHIYQTGMSIFDAQPYSWQKMPNSSDLMLIGRCFNISNQSELEFFDEDLNFKKFNRLPWSGNGLFYSDAWVDNTNFLMTESRVDHSGPKNEYYVGVYRLDTAGQYYNELRLDHPDTIEYMSRYKSMSKFNDSNIYIGGCHTYNFGPVDLPTYVYLYLINLDLNLMGRMTLGGDSYYANNFILSTPDNGCLVVASRYDSLPEIYESDVVIWKVMQDEMTIVTSVENLPPERLQTVAWPNPAQNDLYINLEGFAKSELIRFRIYDLQGRKCLDKQMIVTANSLHVVVKNLRPAEYIYEIEDPNHKFVRGKFLKK